MGEGVWAMCHTCTWLCPHTHAGHREWAKPIHLTVENSGDSHGEFKERWVQCSSVGKLAQRSIIDGAVERNS